ncbi:MAG: hypothetical protein GWO08_03100 [Gammaproteobacteria bacterium]|nr:hypothetical protein [Gammaproteobacteria bacterium]NIR92674.1 hypothetical protein [Gammaproteobacteria bacterium]
MNTSLERLAGQTMPDFSGAPGTTLYQEGWRVNPKYATDGPGGSVTGLEKEEALCLVYDDQPTYRNDNGKIAGSEFIRIRVECLEGSKGSSPKLILREAQ